MGLTLVIMAAGIGSRYGGVKQLDEIGPSGETLMDYSIFDALKAGFNHVVFILRSDLKEAFDEHYKNRFSGMLQIDYVFQDQFKKYEEGLEISRTKPWGTGHAMLSAASEIDTPFAILNADDFYGRPSFVSLAEALKQNHDPDTYFLVGYRLKNTLSDFGSVSRGLCVLDKDNFLVGVTELTKIMRQDDRIVYESAAGLKSMDPEDLVSMNFWGFTPEVYNKLDSGFREFIYREYASPKSEFYIPTFVDGLIKKREARVKVLPAEETWMGVTYREDKAYVADKIKNMIKEGIYPERLG